MAETLQFAATKYLLTIPAIVAVVGKFEDSQVPFIFTEEMLANLEDGFYTPTSAIVLEDGGPLSTNFLTRFSARRLSVTIWATGTRGLDGALVGSTTVTNKIQETFDTLDKVLHRTDPETVQWSTFKTISSERIGSITKPVAIGDGDGIQAATVNYAVFF